MSDTDTLRASRDGDQFHYRWAARQTLQLLEPGTDLVLITIEGVAADGTEGSAGVQVVDMAEYRGGSKITDATSVVYRQLKHSTERPGEDQTASDLKKTIAGFAKIFRDIRRGYPDAIHKVEFELVSNRPVSSSVLRAIDVIASGEVAADVKHEVRHLRQYSGFGDDTEEQSTFFSRFKVDASAPNLLKLDALFHADVAGLLPGTLDFEHIQLKEIVESRATSLETDLRITRGTVLAALRVDDDDLLPALNLIEAPAHVVLTAGSREVLDAVAAPDARTILVHAAGGVGKSVLTTQIQQSLPDGSLTLVYDCFGNGQYRMGSRPRHPHRQGFTQLANELAAHTLCEPLIPTSNALPSDYVRAFLMRVQVAAEAVAARTPGALLAIVVDAADNAVQLAQSLRDRSFVEDLLREQVPDNVRIVMLCRTECIVLLDPPPQTRQVELTGFTRDDSRELLLSVFGGVTEIQVDEFHRMTGGNPRVQAFALESADTIEACLATLGRVAPKDGGPLELDELLRSRVADCREFSPAAPAEIDSLCEAIAALRPRIPVSLLSALCRVPAPAVRSFVADLRRPLLVDGDCVQFRDEPTETWFRTNYRPTGQQLNAFIERFIPLASTQPYAAASLPELMWEAQQLDALVELAMTDAALPEGNDLEQREIAQQRAQYALKAALRSGRDLEATRVALKAGVLAAGRDRTLTMFRTNPDLAGRFLDAQVVEDLVSTRSLISTWPGSNLQYEGAMLSASPGQADMAASKLRTAQDMQHAVMRAAGKKHPVTVEEIAEVAYGLVYANSVEACVSYLSRWRPNRVAFEAGHIVARRLVDAGDIDRWEQLGLISARRAKYLQFAVADAGWYGNLVCTPELARSLCRMLRRQRRRLSFHRGRQYHESMSIPQHIPPVVWIIAMGLRHQALTAEQIKEVARLNLPKALPRGAGDRWSYPIEPLLCGYALLARARQQPFDVNDVAGPDVTEARAKQQPHTHSQVLEEHNRNIVPLGTWATLWVNTITDAQPTNEPSRGLDGPMSIETLLPASDCSYSDYQTPYVLLRGIARIGARVVAHEPSPQSRQRFLAWYRQANTFLGTAAQTDIVHAAAAAPGAPTDHDLAAIMLTAAVDVATNLENTHEEAQERVTKMVALTRALLRFDPIEAQEHFRNALEITDRVGDDALARLQALLALTAAAAADPDRLTISAPIESLNSSKDSSLTSAKPSNAQTSFPS